MSTVRSTDAAASTATPLALRTPCCNAQFKAYYRYEGKAWLAEKVVDGYLCLGEGCYREWDDSGEEVA